MFWRILLVFALFASPLCAQMPSVDIEGPFARVKRNDDGSRTVFESGEDDRTLTKKTYTAEGNLATTTIYRLDGEGNPLKCEIFDGQGSKLYKTMFGYSKRPGPTYGKLVQEFLFDTRQKRVNPETGTEAPVHMFLYTYEADGSANLPIGISLVEGKTAEEVFGTSPEQQALPDLDKLEKVDPANPSARPLNR